MEHKSLPYPEIKSNPGIKPSDPMAEAGRKVFCFHFARMMHHEPGTRLGKDIEELHDMRVATRRMRLALDLFGYAFDPEVIRPIRKGLRATGKALGRVRDLDVFMEKASHYLAETGGDRSGLAPLINLWKHKRIGARGKMLVHLDGKKYNRFKREFNLFVQTSGMGTRSLSQEPPTPFGVTQAMPNRVLEVAPIQIYTRLAVVRAHDSILKDAAIEQLHALRIEFKKLRYAIEFFREVLGNTAKSVIDDIKTLQDHLGDLNDADVACQILTGLLENLEPVREYLKAKESERQHLVDTFPEVWAYFNRPKFRKNLAMAVAVL